MRRILHRIVIRKISLQDYFARQFPRARAAGYLSQQLKRSLGRAKIRHAQGLSAPTTPTSVTP